MRTINKAADSVYVKTKELGWHTYHITVNIFARPVSIRATGVGYVWTRLGFIMILLYYVYIFMYILCI